jgi:hypothetical protein
VEEFSHQPLWMRRWLPTAAHPPIGSASEEDERGLGQSAKGEDGAEVGIAEPQEAALIGISRSRTLSAA